MAHADDEGAARTTARAESAHFERIVYGALCETVNEKGRVHDRTNSCSDAPEGLARDGGSKESKGKL